MHVLAANAQGRGGSSEGIQSIVDIVGAIDSQWDVLFISECDFYSTEVLDNEHEIAEVLAPHRTWRHWPGSGSRSLRFILHSKMVSHLNDMTWCGRVGLLSLYPHDSLQTSCGAAIMGVHGAHGDAILDTFNDASTLRQLVPAASKVICLGDMNVDMLPSFEQDPWADKPNRALHHCERRALLYSWADSQNILPIMPLPSESIAHGRFELDCLLAPISRLPPDSSEDTPSLLDYCVASANFVKTSQLSWHSKFSDHAVLCTVVNYASSRPRFAKTHWLCTSPDSCLDFLRSRFPFVPSEKECENMRSMLCDARDRFQNRASAAMRRQLRMPFRLRCLYSELRRCLPDVRSTLQKQIWTLRKSWVHARRSADARRQTAAGKTLRKSKKLARLTSIVCADGSRVIAPATMVETAADRFTSAWGGGDFHRREVLADWLIARNGQLPDIPIDIFEAAFARMRRWTRLDPDGLCPHLLYLAFIAHPDRFALWIRRCLADHETMKGLTAHAHVYGKKCADSACKDLRAIVPMSSLLVLMDRVLTLCLQPAISALLPPQPGVFIGGQPHTQIQDIGSACWLMMEKGLDLHSAGAVAQLDIQTYFDALPIHLILRWLEVRGVPTALVAAAGRHQMLVKVLFHVSGCTAQAGQRALGGLTGSNVALNLARIPIESVIAESLPQIMPLGFHAHPQLCITVSTWIDNMFCFSGSATGAIAMATFISNALKTDWALNIKPGSQQILVPRDAEVEDDMIPAGWERLSTMTVLGWPISHDCGVRPLWNRLKLKLLGSFWLNARAPGWKELPLQIKVRIFAQTTGMVFRHGCALWPFTQSLAMEVSRFQRRLFAMMTKPARLDDEDGVSYQRRCLRCAGQTIRANGSDWAIVWAKRTAEWHDHILRDYHIQEQVVSGAWNADGRPPTQFSFASVLYSFQPSAWLHLGGSFSCVICSLTLFLHAQIPGDAE